MSVVSTTLFYDGRSGSLALEKLATEHTQQWIVTTDDPEDTDYVALHSNGSLPLIGSVHPDDTRAILTRYTANQVSGQPKTWLITGVYNTVSFDPEQVQHDSPLDVPDKWSYTWVKEEIAIEKDVNGELVQNAAGDPFLPPLTRNDVMIQARVEANRVAFDVNAFVGGEVVNLFPWYDIVAGAVKLDDLSVEPQFDSGIAYFKLNYTFLIKWETIAEAVAVASGPIVYGTPDPGDTVVITGHGAPPAFTHTFTCVAAAPGANEFTNIVELWQLIDELDQLDAENDGEDITVTVVVPGTDANDWTITGTGTFAGLNITFSGGADHDVVGGWVPRKVLNQGYNYLDASGNRRVILDRGGATKPTPTLLTAAGAVLPEAQPPNYRDVYLYRVVDFNTTFDL